MDKTKTILVSAGVVVLLLVVIRLLNLTPSEVGVGPSGVTMKFLGLPPQGQTNTTAHASTQASPSPQGQTNPTLYSPPPAETPIRPVNIAGYWRGFPQVQPYQVQPYAVMVTQSGDSVKMTVSQSANGGAQAVCQGTLSGNTLQIDCTYDGTTARYTGTVGEARIELTTYAQGHAQQLLLTR